MDIWWRQRGVRFLMGEVPLYVAAVLVVVKVFLVRDGLA